MTEQKNNQDRQRKAPEDMTDAELSMRKFLKNLGVTTHQQLEAQLAEAVASGKLDAGSAIDITATVTIDDLDFSHQVTARLTMPDQSVS